MSVKTSRMLPAVLFVAVLLGGSGAARAQCSYSIAYPTNASVLTPGTNVTVSGMITVPAGTTAPNAVKITITDSAGNKYVGTCGVTPMLDPTKFTFQAVITLPSTAATGPADCQAVGSTDGGLHWSAGGTGTSPTIQNTP